MSLALPWALPPVPSWASCSPRAQFRDPRHGRRYGQRRLGFRARWHEQGVDRAHSTAMGDFGPTMDAATDELRRGRPRS
ncbi:MAG: hypothetical protein ACLTSX_10610 [Collinsella sp.]